MALPSQQNIIPETVPERAKRVTAYVEELIAAVGEHPECELKTTWQRETPYHRAEFIKDIQAIANSSIPTDGEKYVVIGADEETREIVGCHHRDFDEAPIRQLLEAYLDPVPEFEVLALKSSNGKDFVVFRIPHQLQKPFVVKSSIQDRNSKFHLSEGQIWVKPGSLIAGSTSKRLLKSRSEILEMIDLEPHIAREIEYRLSQILPEIRREERSRIGNTTFGVVPSLTSTEDEFELYIEQIITANDQARFKVLIERLRDVAVEYWDAKGENRTNLTAEEILDFKTSQFLPAMQRILLLGTLIIKFQAPVGWFKRIADLLVDVYNTAHNLAKVIPFELRSQKVESLAAHLSGTIPALESIMVSHLLVGYEITKKSRVKYSSTFFPRLVETAYNSEYSSESFRVFYLFNKSFVQNIDRRLDWLIPERYGSRESIIKLFGGENLLRKAALQVDCLIDWHSFLSFKTVRTKLAAGEPETADYFATQYSNISANYLPVYVRESFENILPLVKKIWSDLSTGKNGYFLLDSKLAAIISTFDVNKRKQLFARFLIEAENLQSERIRLEQRIGYLPSWDEEINSLIQTIRNSIDK